MIAVSRTHQERKDAIEMGATQFITTEDIGWDSKNKTMTDLVIDTAVYGTLPISCSLDLLSVYGTFV